MFFNSKTIHTLKIKIAPYAKLPYVIDDRNYYKSDYEPYNQIHNTMYCVESISSKTCFYIRGNTINYYRKQVDGQELFLFDNSNETYRPIQFKRLDIGINDENTIAIKTEKGKLYLITRYTRDTSKGQYVFIIDALSGTWLYKEEIKNNINIYIDILHPVANRILPIIHVTRWNVYVKLFDMQNENIYTMITLNLEDIDDLVKLIVNDSDHTVALKNRLLDYKIEHIENFSVVETKYLYKLSDKNFIYTKGIICRFSFEVRYRQKEKYYYYDTCMLRDLFCHIELDQEDVNCWLDSDKVNLNWSSFYSYRTFKFKDKLKPIIHKYSLSNGFGDIYLSTCLYKDNCYYIYSTAHGIDIIEVSKNKYIELSPKQAALYRFGKYLIIFLYTTYTSLVIIDTEHNRIGYWTCEYCKIDYHRIHYEQHYSKLQSKLIFVSKDLERLLIIDIEKIYLIFNNNDYSECIGNYDNNNKDKSCEILCCFNLNQLIVEAISRQKGTKIDDSEVKPISYYIDTNLDTLYILATHFVDGIEYIGVFSLRMSCNNFTFKKLYYSPISVPYHGLVHNTYNKLCMSKIFFYRIDEDVSRELNMAYNENVRRLVDIRYNRNSIDVYTMRHALTGQSVFNYKDLIVVRYITTISDPDRLSLLFIRSELALVRPLMAKPI